jgi:Beta-lactamase
MRPMNLSSRLVLEGAGVGWMRATALYIREEMAQRGIDLATTAEKAIAQARGSKMYRRQFIQRAAAPILLSVHRSHAAVVDGAATIQPPSTKFMASLPRLMEVAILPGVGIGVVSGNRLVWSHCTGLADATTATPITPDSLFPGCSLGKPCLPTDAPTGTLGAGTC